AAAATRQLAAAPATRLNLHLAHARSGRRRRRAERVGVELQLTTRRADIDAFWRVEGLGDGGQRPRDHAGLVHRDEAREASDQRELQAELGDLPLGLHTILPRAQQLLKVFDLAARPERP